MGRFFIDSEDLRDGEALISGREARHVSEVMRLGSGDRLVLFDGSGLEYSGTIKSVSRGGKEVRVALGEARAVPRENIPAITLAQAIPKKSKMDQIVEKATELGVGRIIPMLTERTVVRPEGRSGEKAVERWRRIAVEASKQCGRSVVPDIGEITDLEDVLGSRGDFDLLLMACLSEESLPLRQVIPRPLSGNMIVMIGPEGDFTPREIERAGENNFVSISLGNRVLKSDTAGLFMLSVLIYEGSENSSGVPGKAA